MKQTFKILTILFGLSSFETFGQTPEQKASNSKEKLNLDSVLNVDKNTYLVELKDSELSLCNYELLNLPATINYKMFSASTETYSIENNIKKVNVYRSDSSFLKTFFNSHPDVNRLDLVYGQIFSNKPLAKSEVKIGMTKESVLNTIFKPSPLYSKIDKLTIYENELGDAMTILIFRNNRLTEIRFDSSYDWITKRQ